MPCWMDSSGGESLWKSAIATDGRTLPQCTEVLSVWGLRQNTSSHLSSSSFQNKRKFWENIVHCQYCSGDFYLILVNENIEFQKECSTWCPSSPCWGPAATWAQVLRPGRGMGRRRIVRPQDEFHTSDWSQKALAIYSKASMFSHTNEHVCPTLQH